MAKKALPKTTLPVKPVKPVKVPAPAKPAKPATTKRAAKSAHPVNEPGKPVVMPARRVGKPAANTPPSVPEPTTEGSAETHPDDK